VNPDTERIIQQAIDEGIAQAYAKGYFDGFVDALAEREKFITKEITDVRTRTDYQC